MSVLVKKLHINEVEVFVGLKHPKHFLIPKDKAQGLLKLLSEYEIVNETREFISADEVFPELANAIEGPASILRGAREKEGLSQVELANKLKITQGDLSKMENGKRSIGKKMAMKLSKILNIDYRVFL